ncbi:MAG: urate hydroxylase PuuD [Gammaproteobacteria bacterium]|nr:urate hydroxylase PuuD [Gammaproteobacteria bacterium]MDE2249894.1 urate hydroxylase PuuD [Gammaproteobacteria bacterium]
MNPLNSVRGAIITGVIVAVAITIAIPQSAFNEMGLIRWLHILAGVMWIGLLWYFNVVQVPALGEAAADKGGPGGAGISKYVAPRALLWFRWAAVATWLTGAAYLIRGQNFLNAFTFGHFGEDIYGLIIGTGAWLGTIMLFNVWVLINPNQMKVLGFVPATDEEKVRARRVALLASRTNFVLSIPMLMCMAGATHGLPY